MNICYHIIRSVVELHAGGTQINNNLNNRAHTRLQIRGGGEISRFIILGLSDYDVSGSHIN